MATLTTNDGLLSVDADHPGVATLNQYAIAMTGAGLQSDEPPAPEPPAPEPAPKKKPLKKKKKNAKPSVMADLYGTDVMDTTADPDEE